MSQNNLTCPHCKGQISYTLIAHKAHAQQQGSIFEQSVSTPDTASIPITTTTNKTSFWQSDGIIYSMAGVFAAGVLWYFDVPGPIVAGSALLVGAGLHLAKIWLHRPARPVASKPQHAVKLQIEHISDDKQHWILDELQLDISQQQLTAVAGAIVSEKFKWSMSITTGSGLSQSKHHKLKEKFLASQYIRPLPNNQNGFVVTGRGRRVLRELALFPT